MTTQRRITRASHCCQRLVLLFAFASGLSSCLLAGGAPEAGEFTSPTTNPSRQLEGSLTPPFATDLINSEQAASRPELPGVGVDLPVNQFGFILRRDTDPGMFPPNDADRTFGNEYSKIRAITMDDAYMIVGNYRILRLSDHQIVGHVPGGSLVPSNTDANIIFNMCAGTGRRNALCAYNIRTEENRQLKNFPEFSEEIMSVGSYEGNLSSDDRYLLVESNSHMVALQISDDLQSVTELARKSKSSIHNWAGFSLSGQYIVVEDNDGTPATRTWTRYSRTFTDPQVFARGGQQVEHSVFAVDDEGNDVLASAGGNRMYYVRLNDLKAVSPAVSDNNVGYGHLSAAINDPGYVYFAQMNGPNNMVQRFKLALKPGGGTFQDYGRTVHEGVGGVWVYGPVWTDGSSYNNMPMPSVNSNGRMVVFRSNWQGQLEKSCAFTYRLAE